MKKNILIITLVALIIQPGIAKKIYKGEVSVEVSTYAKQNNKMIVNADIILDKLKVAANDMLTITPVIRSLDGTDQMEFEPLIINGSTRNKVNQRAIGFGNYSYPENTAGIVKRNNGKSQQFSYSIDADYSSWMRSSELVFIESVTGCNCADKGNITHPGQKLELPPPYTPQFELAYLIPAVEAVKHRADSYSASLDYAISKSDIDRNFKNNDAVLKEVDRIISEIKNDPNIVLDKIVVTGYASPDGDATYNMLLSEKRANTFMAYLINKHNLPQNLITTNWKGEDWQGLRTLISQSDYSYRNDILQIIDNTNDINKRKAALKNLRSGAIYRNLLETDFPGLRRNSYDIFYTVRGLDINQSKALINVKPQQLSLNEMFMVANSYEKGSKEFKETFNIAVRLYPEDAVALFNSLTSDIETGSFDNPITGLQHTDKPEGWNNMAVALFHKGDYQSALHYFEKASQTGLREALDNLSQYKLWLESKDN
ncbi:DUF3868 domain-containing protein [Dysgonomonas sp. HDW5B]|uniref:OmpA family protein n=1 Tax=Dysgonomonas sp. HDW5B TaxID=2714927 RepID=UPI00140C5C53|nr:DUF3868 domain-containing protein [Dysgonomonas sp. HDW5B]QIK55255.1 DUF3868 domain-containing protein [Dysgonomonas sp. HDW5B]